MCFTYIMLKLSTYSSPFLARTLNFGRVKLVAQIYRIFLKASIMVFVQNKNTFYLVFPYNLWKWLR
jgi:hypothetical protein